MAFSVSQILTFPSSEKRNAKFPSWLKQIPLHVSESPLSMCLRPFVSMLQTEMLFWKELMTTMVPCSLDSKCLIFPVDVGIAKRWLWVSMSQTLIWQSSPPLMILVSFTAKTQAWGGAADPLSSFKHSRPGIDQILMSESDPQEARRLFPRENVRELTFE